jgi:hypothetical protein
MEQQTQEERDKEIQEAYAEQARPWADEDIIPFGKHRGKKLANVPAHYLVWFWENAKIKQLDRAGYKVFKYVDENIEDLRKEARQG